MAEDLWTKNLSTFVWFSCYETECVWFVCGELCSEYLICFHGLGLADGVRESSWDLSLPFAWILLATYVLNAIVGGCSSISRLAWFSRIFVLEIKRKAAAKKIAEKLAALFPFPLLLFCFHPVTAHEIAFLHSVCMLNLMLVMVVEGLMKFGFCL